MAKSRSAPPDDFHLPTARWIMERMETQNFTPTLPARANLPRLNVPTWDPAHLAQLRVNPAEFPLSQKNAAALLIWLREVVEEIEQAGLGNSILTLGAFR